MKNKLISEIGETKLIQILLNKRDKELDIIDSTIIESYHDDAALIKNSSEYTVISTDMLIQRFHFPETMTYYQMGEKVVTVNVSDILAMNAVPESIVVSMGLPPELKYEDFEALVDGILSKCKEYEISLIGGDINQNNEIILCGTTTGKINEGVKLQTNITNHDLIAVSGQLGGPAAALDLINNENDVEFKDVETILKTLLEPDLPLGTSKVLRKYPEIITSLTDITDGLAVELGHLHEKNETIGFEIYYDKLPFNQTIIEIAKSNNKDLLDYLLHFGEEFELLMTINEEEYIKHQDELDIYIIGRTNNSNKITLIKDEKEEIIPVKGYEHLKDD